MEEVKDKLSYQYGSMKSVYVYISSHFSCSSAAFCNIAQTGGGNQGQGELSLWFHGVVWCCCAMLLLLCDVVVVVVVVVVALSIISISL